MPFIHANGNHSHAGDAISSSNNRKNKHLSRRRNANTGLFVPPPHTRTHSLLHSFCVIAFHTRLSQPSCLRRSFFYLLMANACRCGRLEYSCVSASELNASSHLREIFWSVRALSEPGEQQGLHRTLGDANDRRADGAGTAVMLQVQREARKVSIRSLVSRFAAHGRHLRRRNWRKWGHTEPRMKQWHTLLCRILLTY